MPTHRPFRFGVSTSRATSRREWVESAREIEDLGYATLLMIDHFGTQLGVVAGLTAVAEATTTLRLGTFVLDNDFRHPAVLAKEMATLDFFSGGRLELGIGSGWIEPEYVQTGIPFDPPGTRVERMGESVRVLKGLFADGPFSFEGAHYTIRDYEGFPKPAQRPHPPFMIAAGGRKALGIVGREADICALIVTTAGSRIDLTDGPAEATARRVAWLREAAGERFDRIELNSILFDTVVTDDRRAVADRIAARWGVPTDAMLDTTHVLIGSVDHIVEQVQAWRERFGISYLVLHPDATRSFAPVVARLAGK